MNSGEELTGFWFISGLIYDLKSNLFGQHIVQQMVPSAIAASIGDTSPTKPLVMSFHGWPGSGKNYVTLFIAKNYFLKKSHSNFFHLFVGRVHFPNQREVPIYQVLLVSIFKFVRVFVKSSRSNYNNLVTLRNPSSTAWSLVLESGIFFILRGTRRNVLFEETWNYYFSALKRTKPNSEMMEQLLLFNYLEPSLLGTSRSYDVQNSWRFLINIFLHQEQLRSWIRGNVTECPYSMFVFDEVDKMPAGVLDGIKPFLDHHENFDGVDFR